MREMQRGAKISTRGGSESVARGPLNQIMVCILASESLYRPIRRSGVQPRLCRILHCYAGGGGRA